MSWAKQAITELRKGKTVVVKPRGNSMSGRIQSGSLVEVRPVSQNDIISKGNIVLCRVKGTDYLHLVSAVNNNRYQISNNHGHVNGWITRTQIYGIYVRSL